MKRLCLCVLLSLLPALAFSAPERVRARIPGPVPVEIEAGAVNFFVERMVTATGDVVVVRGADTLHAQQIQYDLRTEEITAQGNVEFTQPTRVMRAQQLRYNFKTGAANAATVRAAIAAPQGGVTYYLQGAALSSAYRKETPRKKVPPTATPQQVTPEREFRLQDGVFSTCDLEHPHYAVRAGEIVLRPGDQVVARKVSPVLLGTRLLVVPRIGMSLARGDKPTSFFPRLVVSKTDTVGLRSDLKLGVPILGKASGYAVVSVRETFRAGFGIEQFGSIPIGIRAGFKEDATSRFISGLTVSDYPAITFFLPRTLQSTGPLQIGQVATPSPERMLKGNIEGGKWDPGCAIRFLASGSAGRFTEHPTDVTDNRLNLSGAIEARPLRVMPHLDLSGALRGRIAYYEKGDHYGVITPELGLTWQPSATDTITSYFRYHGIGGSTPFFFDREDSRRSLRLGWENRTSNHVIGLSTEYDMDDGTFYAWDASYSHRLHCLQPGLVLRRRGTDYGIGLTIQIPGVGGS